jgi:hypothetical protein
LFKPPRLIVTSSQKTGLHLIRNRQAAHGELDLPVGKLSPALDNFLVPALRSIIDNVTHLETRRLQGQRKRLNYNVIIFDPATVALQAGPIRKKSRSIHEILNRLFRNRVHVSGLAQLGRRRAFRFPGLIIRHLAAHCYECDRQAIAPYKIFHFVFAAAKRTLFSMRNRPADNGRDHSASDAIGHYYTEPF